MNGKQRIHAAMRHEPVDRVPVMCQLAIGHYLLNTDVAPAELWFTSEGFARALVDAGPPLRLRRHPDQSAGPRSRLDAARGADRDGGRRQPDGVLHQRRPRPLPGRRQRAALHAQRPPPADDRRGRSRAALLRRSARPGRAEVSVLLRPGALRARPRPLLARLPVPHDRPGAGRGGRGAFGPQRDLLALHAVDGVVRLPGGADVPDRRAGAVRGDSGGLHARGGRPGRRSRPGAASTPC